MKYKTFSVRYYHDPVNSGKFYYPCSWNAVKSIVMKGFGAGYWHIEQLDEDDPRNWYMDGPRLVGCYDVVELKQLDDAEKFFRERK